MGEWIFLLNYWAKALNKNIEEALILFFPSHSTGQPRSLLPYEKDQQCWISLHGTLIWTVLSQGTSQCLLPTNNRASRWGKESFFLVLNWMLFVFPQITHYGSPVPPPPHTPAACVSSWVRDQTCTKAIAVTMLHFKLSVPQENTMCFSCGIPILLRGSKVGKGFVYQPWFINKRVSIV